MLSVPLPRCKLNVASQSPCKEDKVRVLKGCRKCKDPGCAVPWCFSPVPGESSPFLTVCGRGLTSIYYVSVAEHLAAYSLYTEKYVYVCAWVNNCFSRPACFKVYIAIFPGTLKTMCVFASKHVFVSSKPHPPRRTYHCPIHAECKIS